jgi:hypothetical protein
MMDVMLELVLKHFIKEISTISVGVQMNYKTSKTYYIIHKDIWFLNSYPVDFYQGHSEINFYSRLLL